ncbi:hypothetical protein [Nostoc sp. MS1]|uniref:hypothetical protein n=1 Tax=Nostoc sp. MS1 TaxID=2764711 RepID=UPI001CC4438D|nr:hypothetical protein [Nostoc sp. MS1]
MKLTGNAPKPTNQRQTSYVVVACLSFDLMYHFMAKVDSDRNSLNWRICSTTCKREKMNRLDYRVQTSDNGFGIANQ